MGATEGEPYADDFVLANGETFRPETGRFEQSDVAVSGGQVIEVGRPLKVRRRANEIDCSGCCVVPGLVDCHAHILPYASRVGVPPDQAHLLRGTVAVADAGTAGAATFAALKRFACDVSAARVVAFLNVGLLGIIDMRIGELRDEAAFCKEDAIAVAREHPDIVKGFKIRLSADIVGGSCLPYLEPAVDLASGMGLPLMIHIGATVDPLGEILSRLRPGDVVSHCYHGKANGLLDDGKRVIPEAWDARARGVLFDCAHGTTNLNFEVARRAIEQGFPPDLISTDLSRRNWAGPVYDLVTTMSKFLGLGLDLAEILKAATLSPARLLQLDAEGFGTIREGGPANLTVLRVSDEPDDFEDANHNHIAGRRIEPTLVVRDGRMYTPLKATEEARLVF